MFYCERCSTRFNAGALGNQEMLCPRCKARDGVVSPLTFKIFERTGGRTDVQGVERQARDLEDAGREESA